MKFVLICLNTPSFEGLSFHIFLWGKNHKIRIFVDSACNQKLTGIKVRNLPILVLKHTILGQNRAKQLLF